MFLPQVIEQAAAKRGPVKIAVIGAGTFGAGIVVQAARVPQLRVCAVADADVEKARKAYQVAGLGEPDVAICASEAEATRAFESGRPIVTPDTSILFNLDLDLIVEATGHPESGARHALAAINAGKHVAMVTKETDTAVGPVLKRMADRAGVVYTAVDGDQHGLVIGLVGWARSLGLDVVCAGKLLDDELVVDPLVPEVAKRASRMPLSAEQAMWFLPGGAGRVDEIVRHRAAILGPLAGARPWDLAELTIAANATGLSPDIPRTHCPPCWASEIPAILCERSAGGVLSGPGRIDAAQILRQRHEASLGGGVFVVVRTQPDLMQKMARKGMICHRSGDTMLLLHPHHLLGIEAIGSILTAALLQVPTAAVDYRPRFDAVYRTTRALAAGQQLDDDHSPDITAEILPASRLAGGSPLPAALAAGNCLRCDVPAQTILTTDMFARPADSVLWSLREQQDREFR